MAEIPLLHLVTDAPEEADDGSRVSSASSGRIMISRMFDVPVYTFNLRWEALTKEQYAQLRDFYESNRFQTVEYTDPFTDIQYSVMMLGRPQVPEKESFRVSVELVVAGEQM